MTMPQETFENLLDQLDQLVAVFEDHRDPAVEEQAAALLSAVDMVHREGLTRLAARLREIGGEELFEKVASEPVVRVIFGLYDLIDLALPDEAPADAVTPFDQFIRQHGVQPTWQQVATTDELPAGTMRRVDLGSMRLLLVNVGGEICAYRNACHGTELPLEMGQLQGHELVCPWHGCQYDARTGRRTDGGKGRLEVCPVSVRGSSIELAFAPVKNRATVS